MFYRKNEGSLAFSLTELLITLLVVSLLVTAMAPAMTKKHRESMNVAGGSDANKSNGAAILDASGIVDSMGNAKDFISVVLPGVFLFSNSTKKDIDIKKLVLQGGGGGGGGYHRSGDLTFIVNNQSSGWPVARASTAPSTDNFKYGWPVPVGVSNVRIALLAGGGGGGSANGYVSTTAAAEAFLASGAADGGGDLCIKKYNIGDIPSLNGNNPNAKTWSSGSSVEGSDYGGIPLGTKLVSAVASGGAANTGTTNTCWFATATYSTAPKGGSYPCTDSTGTGYSGCYRTLCTWDVADKACRNLGWRLPTDTEIQRWRVTPTSNSAYQAKGIVTGKPSGADFCDYTSSLYGSSVCYYVAGGCPGSAEGRCYPYLFWSLA